MTHFEFVEPHPAALRRIECVLMRSVGQLFKMDLHDFRVRSCPQHDLAFLATVLLHCTHNKQAVAVSIAETLVKHDYVGAPADMGVVALTILSYQA
jgi:hypothetical protein